MKISKSQLISKIGVFKKLKNQADDNCIYIDGSAMYKDGRISFLVVQLETENLKKYVIPYAEFVKFLDRVKADKGDEITIEYNEEGTQLQIKCGRKCCNLPVLKWDEKNDKKIETFYDVQQGNELSVDFVQALQHCKGTIDKQRGTPNNNIVVEKDYTWSFNRYAFARMKNNISCLDTLYIPVEYVDILTVLEPVKISQTKNGLFFASAGNDILQIHQPAYQSQHTPKDFFDKITNSPDIFDSKALLDGIRTAEILVEKEEIKRRKVLLNFQLEKITITAENDSSSILCEISHKSRTLQKIIIDPINFTKGISLCEKNNVISIIFHDINEKAGYVLFTNDNKEYLATYERVINE